MKYHLPDHRALSEPATLLSDGLRAMKSARLRSRSHLNLVEKSASSPSMALMLANIETLGKRQPLPRDGVVAQTANELPLQRSGYSALKQGQSAMHDSSHEEGMHTSRAMTRLTISEKGELDLAQMSRVMGEAVICARVRDFDEKMGGLSGAFQCVDVSTAAGKTVELILKVTGSQKQTAIALGTAREALFLADFGQELVGVVPRVYHCYGDMASGTKEVLMEKLRGKPAGVYFGRGNPNNWSLSSEDLSAAAADSNALEVSKDAFSLYARLHARFWCNESVLSREMLRGADWYSGSGRESWERAQQLAADAWSEQKLHSKVCWDAHLSACVDASFAKVDWDTFRSEIALRPFTIVHGDCHPHNVLRLDGTNQLVLIDFEMVGVGSGPQDLGQFLISHMEPHIRRQHERELMRIYHTCLVSELTEHKDAPDFHDIWTEYQRGGAGRWLWFVPYLASVCPPEMGQYFHDNTAAFLRDHFPDPASVPMPRV